MPVPISDLLFQGLQLMLLGMGTVFVFLTVLVGAMKLMSHFASHFSMPEEHASAAVAAHAATSRPDNNIIAAISVAVKRYRSKRS